MGIFTDLAIGGLTQFGEVAEKDTATNLAMAQNSLNKENKAFQTTELAYKNFDEIKNIESNILELLNIIPTGNFSEDQIVDMYASSLLNVAALWMKFDELDIAYKSISKIL